MPSKFCSVLFFFVFVVQAQSQAQPLGIQRCPSIEEPAARLACYDAAMPPSFTPTRSSGGQSMPAPSTSAPASAAARANKTTAGDPAFGLPERRGATEVQEIESTTGPNFRQWGPNERIRLENGQVWKVTDGSSGSLRNVPSKVTIKKGIFGAYFMIFQERNLSPKVERVE